MSDIDEPALKERLWHDMRADLAQYDPTTNNNELLRCCVCGRPLGYNDFSLEHIIPQQILDEDPKEIKSNPETNRNLRSGNILLCNSPIVLRGRNHKKGCNGFKGKFYDTHLREILCGRIGTSRRTPVTDVHIIAALAISYLAMVMMCGYQMAFTQAGRLVRKQFFKPYQLLGEMPLRSQMLLCGTPPNYNISNIDFWKHPFSYGFDENKSCLVRVRAMTAYLPTSRDPSTPIASQLLITPQRYKLRPDFSSIFS